MTEGRAEAPTPTEVMRRAMEQRFSTPQGTQDFHGIQEAVLGGDRGGLVRAFSRDVEARAEQDMARISEAFEPDTATVHDSIQGS